MRALRKNAARLLKNKGLLAVEVGIGQAEAVAKIMEQYLDSVKNHSGFTRNSTRCGLVTKESQIIPVTGERVRQRALQSGLEGFQDYELPRNVAVLYRTPERYQGDGKSAFAGVRYHF